MQLLKVESSEAAILRADTNSFEVVHHFFGSGHARMSRAKKSVVSPKGCPEKSDATDIDGSSFKEVDVGSPGLFLELCGEARKRGSIELMITSDIDDWLAGEMFRDPFEAPLLFVEVAGNHDHICVVPRGLESRELEV